MKITLDQFVAQWVRNGSSRGIVSRFESNIFEFATIAGHYSKRYFATSFMVGGFYGTGKKWEARQSKWGKKFTHPILIDTGTLKGSIKAEGKRISIDGWSDNRKKIFRKGAKYEIWTTEVSKPIKGKRGKSASRYGHYAAIHNTDPRDSGFTVNQYSTKKPAHRQFIGLNPALDKDIERFIPIIFRGFPNA
jgi:hypothetical protein